MAARKKIAKKSAKSARKNPVSKAARKKSASRKSSASAGGKGAADTKAPRPGSKEEHYADLRRVALASALNRLR